MSSEPIILEQSRRSMEAVRKPSKITVADLLGPKDEKSKLSIDVTPVSCASSSVSPNFRPVSDVPTAHNEPLHLPAPELQGWNKRRIHQWKSPLLMSLFFIIGLAMSLTHCIFYPNLKEKIVGNSDTQEEKIRFGTAFAFLAQISLGASVWASYTQWLWRTVRTEQMTVGALNAAFGADTSVFSLLNVEMLRKLKVGSVMAAFAWGLLLPPFFTPATLFVYQSTNIETLDAWMPYPNIANSSIGHKYAYSPPIRKGTTQYLDDLSRIFSGPRTILSLIATTTASLGEILPIKLPYNNSAYSIDFYGPIVRCADANTSATELIEQSLQSEMKLGDGTIVETANTYYSFVPTFNASGDLVPVHTIRQQSPSNATNELWMTFMRPTINASGVRVKERLYQVCSLHNASYSLFVDRDHGFQNITGSYTINELIAYPHDNSSSISNMAQHAYSAFFWVLCDQLVGKFSWFVNNEYNESTALSTSGAEQFGVLESQIQRTSLLGSLDLDAFFDLDEEKGLYKTPEGNGTLSDQRLMDKAMARNRTLDVLIEELSFNISVSLMWNDLLTDNKSVSVNLTDAVNRYAYKPYGLFIPYGIANVFTLLIVIVGLYSYIRDGVMADKKFQDIVSAAEDPEIVHVIRSRKRSVTAIIINNKLVLRPGSNPERMQMEVLKKVRAFLGGRGRNRRRRE